MNSKAVAALADAVKQKIGTDAERWYEPDGYGSLALAVLDSIYSTGNRYSGVINAVNKYRVARRDEGADPDRDTARDLVEAVDRWGGTDELVSRTNAWRVSSKEGAPRKAAAAYEAAKILARHGLDTVSDVRETLSDRSAQHESPVKKEWLGIPGQSSGLTWTYFLMLCGVPGVKADRMVLRFVRSAVGEDTDAREAAQLVEAVAEQLGVSYSVLDHAIWRQASGRSVLRGDETDD